MIGSADYQRFAFRDGHLTDIGDLMQRKLQTLPPEWCEGSILDVGTDHGFWCFYGVEHGASCALGLDRGRPVKGEPTDLVQRNIALAQSVGAENVHFEAVNLGCQWREFGAADNVLMFSCYHHVYNNCLDHNPIWYWLRQHTDRTLWWEGALSADDGVVRKDVSDVSEYSRDGILNAACQYFTGKQIAPSAISGREVWKFTPIQEQPPRYSGITRSGAGGASKAFKHSDGRRIKEITNILGWEPQPGSLNVMLEAEFDWDSRYYRAQIFDVLDRSKGLESGWGTRWCRFYPIRVICHQRSAGAAVMRFEGERYDSRFVELVSAEHLRSALEIRDPEQVRIQQL